MIFSWNKGTLFCPAFIKFREKIWTPVFRVSGGCSRWDCFCLLDDFDLLSWNIHVFTLVTWEVEFLGARIYFRESSFVNTVPRHRLYLVHFLHCIILPLIYSIDFQYKLLQYPLFLIFFIFYFHTPHLVLSSI